MRWASAASTRERIDEALSEVVERAQVSLGDLRADLVIVFVSPHHVAGFLSVPAFLQSRFRGAAVVGCSAAGTLAMGVEHESGPSIVLMLANLPDVDVRAFHLPPTALQDASAWRDAVGCDPLAAPALILLPDPYTAPGEPLCTAVDKVYAHSVKLGGVSSGSPPDTAALFAGGLMHRSGMVGLALVGDLQMSSVVAQGARMVGPAFVITQLDRNRLQTLDGRAATEVLIEAFEEMSALDQHLFKSAPLVGVSSGVGQHLVRSILSMDRSSGSLTVGFEGDVGQTVRFAVRDPLAAREEMKQLLRIDGEH
ncbi:MAG: small ligand-binding sensory domain FIST, partial [Kiritimatiellia bacterium]